jgi:hypothetical protein
MLPPAYEQALQQLFPDIGSRRHLQNVACRQRALALLSEDPAYRWLCDPEAMQAKPRPSAQKSWRPTILAELGRIPGDEDLKAMAGQICQLKPKTRDAVLLIRGWRKGKESPGNARQLAAALVACINDYLKRHPSTTWSIVRAALDAAGDAVDQSAGAADGEEN